MKTKKLSLQIVEDEVAEILADLHTELYVYGPTYKKRKNGFNDLKYAIKERVYEPLSTLRKKLLKQSVLN
jgi:hypothetical protein